MADKAAPTTAAPATHSHVVDGKTIPCNKPVFGPFGDKALHGTALLYGSGVSNPAKRKPEDKLKYDAWCFSFYGPATTAELTSFVKAKPDNVRSLVVDALKSEARFASWHENRGGTTTTRVSVNGAPATRLPNAIVALLRSTGQTVVDVPDAK